MNSSLVPGQNRGFLAEPVAQNTQVNAPHRPSDQWIELLSKLSLVSSSNDRLDSFDFEPWAKGVRSQLVKTLRSRYRSNKK